MPRPAQAELERLRSRRARPERAVPIAATVSAIAADVRRTHKRHGELIELWERFVPADLAAQSSIVSFRGGVAQVQVESAAASFEIDRLLRSGVLATLRQNFSGTLTRIKVKVGV